MPLVHAYDPPPGITKRILPGYERRDISFEPVARMILTFGQDVSVAVIAGWILNKLLKHRDKTYIKIDHKEVSLDQGEIERVIHTVIEIKKNDH